ncbi:cobalamin biosynthesis protein CobD/CbiB [Amycolatopsis pithecellobii]|uniref:Cobalamin biosynthesis protein n=1 Tax=Amycolatopsis pithecellobii TaxID=664692 RepID=A0A6N7Z954_9PSEU|nr:cobalamin biosynthesis protein [Amycolatopsis pithecellobii]MTD58106.1 cobalamin biosynthesis protein [Amycolatopsis pithecellobii]
MDAARAVGLLLGAAADGVIERREPVLAGRKLPAAGLAGGLVAAGIVVERVTRRGPVLQALGTAVATWAVLGGAKLAAEGTALARDLEESRLDDARAALADLDPRRTESLDVIGLSRASIESLARHTSDSVVAPMFWGAVAGIPGLVGARALGLLRHDRLVGRLHELAGFVPARLAAALTVAGAPVVGGSARGAWRAWQRDTVAHPDPNTARVDAAFAGALEVRLGGRAVYPHGIEERPVLGEGRNPDAGHVTRAVELSRVVGWLAAVSSAVLAVLTGLRRRSR